jgi:thymidylate synthase (FAD)
MAHIIVPEAEAVLDNEIKVLDHGFIRLIDYMGSDDRIVQTARVSYGEGTKPIRQDGGAYRLFAAPSAQLPLRTRRLRIPLQDADLCCPPVDPTPHRAPKRNFRTLFSHERRVLRLATRKISFQSADNKQGRNPEDVPAELQDKVIELLKKDQENVYSNYEDMIENDITRELARINLPLSLYTEWYWQMDLKNMFHFLALRMDSHAQWEIQEYGRAMAKVVKAVCPLAYESFDRHMVNGARVSGDEIAAIKKMISGEPNPLKGRRLDEFADKLNK